MAPTNKQEKFVHEYLLTSNATQAAIKALLDEVNNGNGNARVNSANSILDRTGFNLKS